jgi:hydrogenase maturation protease
VTERYAATEDTELAKGPGEQEDPWPPHMPSESSASSVAKASTLVLGLGNPILRDDGVGWRVVEAVQGLVPPGRAEFDCVGLGGLALMERLIGYQRAILVDAIQTVGGLPGALYRLGLDDLPTLHANAIHDASLKDALELGRRLGAVLPSEIVIIAVEAADVLDFGESLSPPVEVAVPAAVAAVLAALC